MKIVENQITSYISANFSESETAWLLASVFNYGDTIRDGHYLYQYAGQDGTNSILTPSVDSIGLNPVWVEYAPSNYYAMLDGKTSNQTSNLNTIVITVACSNYDTISLLNIEGVSVDLSLYDNTSASVVYTNSIDLTDTTEIVDFYTYCFNPFTFLPSIYVDTMPLYNDAELTITLTATTGSDAKIGRLVFGRSFYVGDTSYGASLGLESYSSKVTDEFGNVSLVHRGSVNLDTYQVYIPTNKVPMLIRKGQELDAIPILFIMDESSTSNLQNLLNYGYWQTFNMIIPNPVKSTMSITVKGIL